MPNAGVLATIKGTVYNQFEKEVLATQIRFGTLEAIFEIDHEVQRQLDPSRRAEIRSFILDAVEKNKPFYFSPFIFSSRKNIRHVEEGFELKSSSKIYIIDGQHRGSALSSAIFTSMYDPVAGQIKNHSTTTAIKRTALKIPTSHPSGRGSSRMIINDVFEKKQTIITYPLKELLQMLSDGRLTLRETNNVQVRAIRKYILDNLLKEQVYLPPLVAMVEEGLEEGVPDRLILIDGSQRMKALSQMESVVMKTTNSEVAEEQKKGFMLLYSLDKVELAVQIIEGLSTDEADQLFIDLNTKGKKVSLSKRIAYDSRNDINRVTNQVLQSNAKLREAGVEQEKNAVMRPRNKNLLSLSQLRQLVALFTSGKTLTSQLAMDTVVPLRTEETIELINTWFGELFKLHSVRTIGNYEVSMLASFPLLYAVANYAIEGMEGKSVVEKKQEIIGRMQRLKTVEWRRDSQVWRQFNGNERGREKYFYLMNNKKNISAIIAWLRIKGGE